MLWVECLNRPIARWWLMLSFSCTTLCACVSDSREVQQAFGLHANANLVAAISEARQCPF